MNLPPRGASWVMLKIQLVDRYANWYSESPKKRLCEGSNPSLPTIGSVAQWQRKELCQNSLKVEYFALENYSMTLLFLLIIRKVIRRKKWLLQKILKTIGKEEKNN